MEQKKRIDLNYNKEVNMKTCMRKLALRLFAGLFALALFCVCATPVPAEVLRIMNPVGVLIVNKFDPFYANKFDPPFTGLLFHNNGQFSVRFLNLNFVFLFCGTMEKSLTLPHSHRNDDDGFIVLIIFIYPFLVYPLSCSFHHL